MAIEWQWETAPFPEMNTRPAALPDFAFPPVVETVLSVQFEPLVDFRAAHFGLLWDRIRDRFPKTEERAELVPVIERFPSTTLPGVGIRLEPLENVPLPRVWFANADGTELVQVQRDRFIKNWRKTGDGDRYPRYEAVKARFDADFLAFQEFLREQGLGEVQVNQCEVTYVNHILPGPNWAEHGQADQVFSCWRMPEGDFPGGLEEVSFQASFVIPGEDGAPAGRLHAHAHPALRSADHGKIFVLNLTARGQIGEGTAFHDTGRAAIVRSFRALTTPAMHAAWGLQE